MSAHLKRISYPRARHGIDEMPSADGVEEHPWIGNASALIELRRAIDNAIGVLIEMGAGSSALRLRRAVTACVKRGLLGER